jgi:peptidyl-tRNA hydrolase, PTH1 family
MSVDPWLIVGLGNPGPEYAGNRHNAGFMVVDRLADGVGGRFKPHRSQADVLEARLDGHRVILAKPRTYMNESGGPVAGARNFFDVPLDRVVVVHDELDIDFGALRFKRGGGDGGHNGLRSVTKSLGSPDYLRVRFGIGRPAGRTEPAAYVLRDFAATERQALAVDLATAADAIRTLLTAGLAVVQDRFHTR